MIARMPRREVEGLSVASLLLAAGVVVVVLAVSWLIIDVAVRADRKRRMFLGVFGGVLVALVYTVSRHGPEVVPIAARMLAAIALAALWLAVVIQTGREAPKRRLVIAGIPLSLGALAWLVVPGWIADHYHSRNEAIDRSCWNSRSLPTLAARQAALDDALGRFADLGSHAERARFDDCQKLEDELVGLRERGVCPDTPIEGLPCSCGEQKWPADAPCRESICAFDTPGGYVPNPHDYPRVLKCR